MIMYFAKRFLFLQTLLHFLLRFGTSSLDAITTNQNIRDGGEFLVSTGETFAFGFFTPGESTHRYVGIWYHSNPGKIVVWVANRDNPIKDNTGVLSIDVHGNLVLHAYNRSRTPIWSTNHVSKPSRNNNTLAQLEDSGNLVLMSENGTGEVLWESFDYPTHIYLPKMKIGIDRKTGLNRFLTSWKSKDDPGTGNWSFKIHTNGSPQLFLYNGDVLRWRSGHWTGLGWSGIPTTSSGNQYFIYSLVDNQSETTTTWSPSLGYPVMDTLDESGTIQTSAMIEGQNKWTILSSLPYTDGCDTYGECGVFGSCDINAANDSKCSCLPGFLRNASGGCARKWGEASLCRSGEGFKKVVGVKVPDTSMARVNTSVSFGVCREVCLQNCSCLAYASVDVKQKGGCITWHGDLVDTRVFKEGGQDLYVRVDALELGEISASTVKKSKGFFANKRRPAIVVVAVLFTSFLLLLYASWLIKRKRKGSKRQVLLFDDDTNGSQSFFQDSTKLDESRRKLNVRFFDLSTIIAATDNFSLSKRLGQGGFGPVYKGQLANGQEIAVKTHSRSSKQGTEEFKNEVKLIAKLQHRNLVRLFGCCIHKEEKMLIYEYMPNKSLDFFIFDEIRRKLLDWRKRFDIISGIARGVLYLHQDSRLKIIHRDLKASNVLLDDAMNPKISDFGLARMFGDDQDEANTRKVVGTYGYMSPEYAMEGLYSIKSDVFSYGILTLEIISGKKNNYYHIGSPSLNLIGYVWDLWMDGKAMDAVDPSLGKEYPTHEVLRCIQIGLLCVQEQATDRPTMLEIVFMLGNEATVPSPNKPAFINRTIKSGLDSSSSKGLPASVNKLTITMPEGR